MSYVLIEGMNAGEFRQLNVKAANEMFYSLIESSIFRLAILDQQNVNEIFDVAALAIEGIKKS